MGKCALCKEEKELKKSHIIPRFLYKYMLGVAGDQIIQFDGTKNLWQKSNRQMQRRLLCSECEGRLGKNETLFSSIFRKINEGDRGDFFCCELPPEFMNDLEACGYGRAELNAVLESSYLNGKSSILKYFSISYIYRELIGNKYSAPFSEVEKMRRYLLGERELKFMLNVRVNSSECDFNLFTSVVVMDGLHDWKHFLFYMPNMQFHVAVNVEGVPEGVAGTAVFPADFKEDEIGTINLLRRFQKEARYSRNLNK